MLPEGEVTEPVFAPRLVGSAGGVGVGTREGDSVSEVVPDAAVPELTDAVGEVLFPAAGGVLPSLVGSEVELMVLSVVGVAVGAVLELPLVASVVDGPVGVLVRAGLVSVAAALVVAPVAGNGSGSGVDVGAGAIGTADRIGPPISRLGSGRSVAVAAERRVLRGVPALAGDPGPSAARRGPAADEVDDDDLEARCFDGDVRAAPSAADLASSPGSVGTPGADPAVRGGTDVGRAGVVIRSLGTMGGATATGEENGPAPVGVAVGAVGTSACRFDVVGTTG